jgi:quercetin dioxygenase-like cupin family protein
MSKLQSLQSEALSEVASSPGITRHLVFKGEGFRILLAKSDPGVTSGWHHHGDYDVYGYIVSGTGRFESDFGEGEAISIGTGEFFHVPPHTVHREINPSPGEANEMLLFLHGKGPLVFNMDDPDQA